MLDLAIIGGGIMGLSTAYQLSGTGHRIAIVDRSLHRTQASWAAAGLIPPADAVSAPDAYERLRAYSRVILPKWCEQLQHETGISPEFKRRGAIHVARSTAELAALTATVAQWREEGILAESLNAQQLGELEPALKLVFEKELIRGAFHLPDEATLRPPRLLKALKAACSNRGVDWRDAEVAGWVIDGQRATPRLTSGDWLHAQAYCVCGGAWSARHLTELGLNNEIIPWRGQMLLLRADNLSLKRVIYEGPNYIVPRDDGLYLVGSTMEDTGFDGRSTQAAHDMLRQFASDLVPELRQADLVQHWTGFRPGTADGDPMIGRIEPLQNVYVATGHFRSGIAMAAGTAAVLGDIIQGRTPSVDVSTFRPNR